MAAGNIAKALRANNYLAPVADVVKSYYAKQAEQQRKKQLLDLQTNVINNLNAAMQPKQVTEQVDLSPYKNLSPTGNLPTALEETKPDPVYGLLKGLMPNTMVPPSPQVSEPQQIAPAPTEQMYGKVDLAKTILPTPQQKQDAVNNAQMEYLQGLQGMTDDPQAQQALSSQIIAATIAKLRPQTPQTVKLGGNEAIYEQNPTTGEFIKKIDNRILQAEKPNFDMRTEQKGNKVETFRVKVNPATGAEEEIPGTRRLTNVERAGKGGSSNDDFKPGVVEPAMKQLDSYFNEYRNKEKRYAAEDSTDANVNAETKKSNKQITQSRTELMNKKIIPQTRGVIRSFFKNDAASSSLAITQFEDLVGIAAKERENGTDAAGAIGKAMDIYYNEMGGDQTVGSIYEQLLNYRVF